ncbi:MAG: PAS domain S-box protein, partial [Candidatus Cloacimonetes bacterium]|nr:PAS domain S-box protein [Candidatus Cloacimonadota bacterium]
MESNNKTKAQLLKEIDLLTIKISELEKSKTERKQSDKALKESEEKYRTIFEATGTATLVVGEDTTIIEANKECEFVTGYIASDLVGKSWTEFVYKEDLLTMLRNSKARIKDPESVPNKYEVRLINAKGEIRNTILSIEIIHGSKRSIVSMIDITEEKQAKEALQKSEEQYKDLVEKGNIAIAVDDVHGNIIYFNKQFLNLFGASAEEIKSKNHKKFIHPDNLEMITNYHKNRIQGKAAPSRYEFMGIRKDGSIINIEIDVCDIIKIGGNILGTRSYMWDITERKLAEVNLQVCVEKYKMLFETAHDAIFVADPATSTILDVNNKALELTGYSRDELIGQNQSFIHPQNNIERYTTSFKEAVKHRGSIFQEVEIQCKNGSIVPVEISSGGEIFIADKSVHLGIFRDITERKITEEQIKKDLKIKTALLQELYHRTKNNMQLIASMLKMQSRSIENKSQAGISSIDFLYDSFDAIINRIKSMSLVHQKLYQAQDLSHVNLKEYVKDLINSLLSNYHIRSETISLKLELEDIFVLIDFAIPMGLVLNELISNVFKHAYSDNKKLELIIRLF